jgi:hypothetical protein
MGKPAAWKHRGLSQTSEMHFMLALRQTTPILLQGPTLLKRTEILISVAGVSKTFKRVNAVKAAGPDGIPGPRSQSLHRPAGWSQVVRVGNTNSAMLTLNTGAQQGCILSPLLYSLNTHDCVARHDSNTIIKFAKDTTVVGLITDSDETTYREEHWR